MSDSPEFVDGFIAKAPHENAPDFVKAKVSINVEDFKRWFDAHSVGNKWLNIDIKVSKGGKWYAAKDNWKPKQQGNNSGSDDFGADW